MENQRLRNLTTERLHTQMEDVYKDIEFLTGVPGIMTHQLPNAVRALTPWLKEKLTDPRFWDGEFDQSHDGTTDIEPMNDAELAEMMKRFGELPSPLAGKEVQVVEIEASEGGSDS